MKHALAAVAVCAMAAVAVAVAAPRLPVAQPHWVAAWGAAADSTGPSLQGRTIRQIVQIGIAGSGVRIRLSNLLGAGPVTIGPVHVAAGPDLSAIDPSTDRAVTFDGKASVTIAKGADALSDPVGFDVSAGEPLAVSLHVVADSGSSTIHRLGLRTAYVTPGDATAEQRFQVMTFADSRFFLTDVEVAAAGNANALVVFGDSITDGLGSLQDRNARWTDALAARLSCGPMRAPVAVINAGIAGNRILHDGPVGPSGLSRFDRDALAKPGVRWIVLLEGINDIGVAGAPATPEDAVSAKQVIDGMQALIARAHARGVRIIGGTLTPFAGTDAPFYSPAGEAKRERINAWIRASGAFDAVVDFDKAVRDPARPRHMLAAFDSGDHLHPNDAGYAAMAEAVDLGILATPSDLPEDAIACHPDERAANAGPASDRRRTRAGRDGLELPHRQQIQPNP